ncbi:MAG: FtsX-like permease family protein [Syntrophales bacterium]|jgi:putative ABC transport system permease protein|nr:FtsX-like permease family protein [Syntrophales bacterium]MCK9527609.1 FtsX-like permease family protein [Syntrophales bacterium]MDX9922226.1 FtsX-like permease family protein [Syntrophales bacterium]
MISCLLITVICSLFVFSLLTRRHDVKQALFNVLRHRRRTAMTLAAIVIGGASLFIFGGFFNYNLWSYREVTIRGDLGHIQLYRKGYLGSGVSSPLKYGISDYKKVASLLRRDDEIGNHIKAIVGQIGFSGILSNYEKGTSSNFIGLGIEPASSVSLGFLDTVTLGSDLSDFDKGGVVIGTGLLHALKSDYDDHNDVLVINKHGGQDAMSVRIRGVFQSGLKLRDDATMKMPLKTAQRLLGTEDVSKVTILLDDTNMTDIVADRVKKIIRQNGLDLEMNTWPEEAVMYKQIVTNYNGIFFFIKVVMAIIVAFFIANTLMINVVERTREIGMIRAMGATRATVWNLLFLEGFCMGLIGGLLSIGTGWIIAVLVNIHGIPMPPAPGQTLGYTAFIRMEGAMDIVWFTFSLSMITSFFASILPAFKASQMIVVDALRHV